LRKAGQGVALYWPVLPLRGVFAGHVSVSCPGS
jgi:hypothetical protein